ncbi:DUF2508 family protein [Clostridium senegalense]|uniref:DUF2508 family protein n=1 Tax=Clostridium senegalense TaxID=1465809 RepID=A0A6M0H6A2_9CLOT|nr:DUF2508 family protein [Clostridium senegalense]NEU06250.1 DUF2508 family protein [Clostridium senegalense]
MNKKHVFKLIFKGKKCSKEDIDIITQLNDALEEWQNAKNYFQFVSDPKLIDLIICKEDEAKSKYLYFLSLAKTKGITLDGSLMLEELSSTYK